MTFGRRAMYIITTFSAWLHSKMTTVWRILVYLNESILKISRQYSKYVNKPSKYRFYFHYKSNNQQRFVFFQGCLVDLMQKY